VIGSDDVAVGEHEAQERSGFGVWREGDRHYLDGKDISEQMIGRVSTVGFHPEVPRSSGFSEWGCRRCQGPGETSSARLWMKRRAPSTREGQQVLYIVGGEVDAHGRRELQWLDQPRMEDVARRGSIIASQSAFQDLAL
jgi:hypothetical protein